MRETKRSGRAPVLLGLAAVSAMASAAMGAIFDKADAQTPAFDRGRNEGIRDRGRPEYDPTGMPFGGFRLFPTVTVGVESNDNVYATQTNEQSDTILTFAPAAELRSNWSRNELNLGLGSQSREYNDLSDESTTTWHANADGRLDIRRDFIAYGALNYEDGRENRGSNDPAGLAEPIEFRNSAARGSLQKDFGRVRLTGGGEYAHIDYRDGHLFNGTNVDQDFRDHNETEGFIRGDLALSPDTALFLSYSNRDYDYRISSPGPGGDRDFTTRQALAGVAFDVSHLVRGEIGVGSTWAEYDDPFYKDDSGFSVEGRLDWFPTEIVNVSLTAGRNITDAGVVGSSSAIDEHYGVRVDYELRRNILVYGEGGHAKYDYRGIDREDKRTNFGFGADWLVNRWAVLGGSFVRNEQTSDGLNRDRDFDQNVAMITLTLRR